MPRKFKFHLNLTRISGTLHEDQYIFFITSLSVSFKMRNISELQLRKRKHTFYVQQLFLFRKSCRYETMWKTVVKPDRPQMTIWRMCIACWIPKATNTHSECVILLAFPQQQFCRNAPQCHVVRTYIACPVNQLLIALCV